MTIEQTNTETALLDRFEAARFLRMSPTALGRFHRKGEGPPYIRVGRKRFYKEGDLVLWDAAMAEILRQCFEKLTLFNGDHPWKK